MPVVEEMFPMLEAFGWAYGLPESYVTLKFLAQDALDRKRTRSIGSLHAADLDEFVASTEFDRAIGAELYTGDCLKDVAEGVAWWLNFMERAFCRDVVENAHRSVASAQHPREAELLTGARTTLLAYTEAVQEQFEGDRYRLMHPDSSFYDEGTALSLEKVTKMIEAYRSFTKVAVGILADLFPEMSRAKLLQIP